ncbi:MAG: O-antigen ligase family protein [Planctomycetia bacterium]
MASGDRLPADDVAVWLLCGTVVLAPIFLGASGIWSRLAVETAIIVATCLWAASGKRTVWATLIPLAVCGAALLQVLPLPDRILVNFAPVSAGAWKVATEGTGSAWGRISINPGATLCGIRRLFVMCAALAMVTDIARRKSSRNKVLIALATSGAIVVLLALVFGPTNGRRVLGIVDLIGPFPTAFTPIVRPVESAGFGKVDWATTGTQRFAVECANVGPGIGSYIYSNHFAGAVVLTLPVLLGWWLMATRGRMHDAWRWAVVAGGFAIAGWLVGVVADSRAGGIALVVAGVTFVALAAEHPWLRRATTALAVISMLAMLGLTVAGLAVLLSPAEDVMRSLPEAWQPSMTAALNDPRVIATKIALRMFFASPLLGTGIDSYSDVFARFYKSEYTLFYAHNDYAQLLAETGAAGAAALAIVAYVLSSRFLLFYSKAKAEYRVLNAGPWAALTGIAAHSAFDWNLHLPANALIACVVGGLCASSVPPQTPRWASRLAEKVPELLPRLGVIATALVCLAFLARDAVSDHAQRVVRQQLFTPPGDGTEAVAIGRQDGLERAIAFAESVARWDRRNSRLELLLGQACLKQASLADAPDARARWLDAAAKWFLLARWACPLGRGFPQPVDSSAG